MLKPLIAIAAMALATGAAEAKDNHKNGKAPVYQMQRQASGFCPPGLANKGCIPPGQAKKAWRGNDDDRYRQRRDDDVVIRVGDRIDGHYVVVDPNRYGLDPRWEYYRYGDRYVQVDPTTQKVVALLNLLNVLTR